MIFVIGLLVFFMGVVLVKAFERDYDDALRAVDWMSSLLIVIGAGMMVASVLILVARVMP